MLQEINLSAISSSFRDPSGFVFQHAGVIYRQVNDCAAETFEKFTEGGLYQALVEKGYLVRHEDVTDSEVPRGSACHRLLRPVAVPYISYPYEWCFSQLKDAALLTLRIQAVAIKYGFSLKDASAYNVQFLDGKPIFIDTLSFECYVEGEPWVAYRQFCQHFLAPLALSSLVDPRLGRLSMTHIDGIPLDLACRLLPFKSRLSVGLQTHIHLHAKFQSSYADMAGESSGRPRRTKNSRGRISKSGLHAILESLATTVNRLKRSRGITEWANYYSETNYTDNSTKAKHDLVKEFLAIPGQEFNTIHDLGANSGEFSRIAAPFAKLVVSQDIDPVAVESNYQLLKEKGSPRNVLPLLQDLTAPAPGIGWANTERDSFVQRGRSDLVLALALIHHLCIGNNVPLVNVSQLLAALGKWLIIEFVPKSDSQVVRMLSTRKDVFPDYTREGFETSFENDFVLNRVERVEGSERLLYIMKRRGGD